MPRSLFLKLFLWFFLALIVVSGMTFMVGEIARHRSHGSHLHAPPDRAVSAYGQTAATIYERDGQNALALYLDSVERDEGIKIFLFNERLDELTGRPELPGARRLAENALRTEGPEFGEHHAIPLLAQAVSTSRGARYVSVAEVQPPMVPPPLIHQFFHISLVLTIGGLFCYWLARHLTTPVAKIRAATHELARGNLAARVGPSLGNRHDELAALGKDFDLMAEKIESLLNAQRRLLGDISHELRSPLARLNVALELARQRSGPEAISALERIQREAENLNEMIGQLLAITRMEGDAHALRKTELDLRRVLTEVAEDADFEARSRNRRVKINHCDPCTIAGTENLVRRAIENIVRNGVQYTGEGTEVEIDLRCAPAAEEVEQLTVITVRDHGDGVPEDALGKIFQPFYRVDEARDRESGGAGLGLSIAERAVKLHGGTVTAANAIDGGLVVTISLPALL
ncbi:MAG: ATP-binding protein [Pyrinomonadaceae bacterium]